MTQTQLHPQDPTSDAATPVQLCPIPAQRQDTGESIWLVQSRSHHSCCYVLTKEGNTIQCPCSEYQRMNNCEHAAAVSLLLQPQQPEQVSPYFPQRSPSPSCSLHPEPRNEQERQQRERAEQHERALLWTDDRPFSIWKP